MPGGTAPAAPAARPHGGLLFAALKPFAAFEEHPGLIGVLHDEPIQLGEFLFLRDVSDRGQGERGAQFDEFFGEARSTLVFSAAWPVGVTHVRQPRLDLGEAFLDLLLLVELVT